MTQIQRPLLPVLTSGPHGSRSHLTCLYRCGNACDQPIPNKTDHPEFRDVAARALARRWPDAGQTLARGWTSRRASCPRPSRARPAHAVREVLTWLKALPCIDPISSAT